MFFDLIVIGSGPAGKEAALTAAKAGKKVAIIEKRKEVGGDCVHTSTLPSKSFRESVYRWSLGSQSKSGSKPDMSRLLKRRDRVVENESEVVLSQLLRNHVTLYHGSASFESSSEIKVETKQGIQKLKASFIAIAVGAKPVSSPWTVDGKKILDSDSILSLKKLPKSLLVIGAGIVGCEYTSIFSMAGSKVYLLDRRHEVLAAVDREIVDRLMQRFESQKVEMLLGAEAKSIESKKQGVAIQLSNHKKIIVEAVLISQGRFGNTSGLNLELAGVKMSERGLIQVDAYHRTNVPNIYAIGDVSGPPALAATSVEQGRIATCHAFRLKECVMPKIFPYGIYTIPEIAMIGHTEEELRDDKSDYVAGKAEYKEIARGQIVGDESGLLKILVDRQSRKLLGVHIIGDNATDLIHIGQAVMELSGDLDYFIHSVFNYPTLAEAYKTAALNAANQIRKAA